MNTMCVLFSSINPLGITLEQFGIQTLLPFLVVMIASALIFFLLSGAKKRWLKNYREPFQTELMRPPGWSCIKLREDALFNIASIVIALPSLWGAIALLAIHATTVTLIGSVFTAIIMTFCLARSLSKNLIKARTAYLGLFGEWAVAECLEPLSRDGWQVFHDFVIPDTKKPCNIDHIAIGPSGVFAIETKTRSKSAKETPGSNDAKVDGEHVHLADGRKVYPLKQAKRQAATLRNWLNTKGIDLTFVHPVAVLPGWTVKYKTSESSREIRDPRNLVNYLKKITDRPTPEKIQAATEAIEKHCRSLKFSDVGF